MQWFDSLRHLIASSKRSKRRLSPQSSAWLLTESLEKRALLTIPSPVTVTEFLPNEGNDSLGTLTWETELGVDRYEYWVSQLGYGQIDTGVTMNGGDSATVSVAYGDWNRVWVRGINEDGTGQWGPAFTVIVGDELPARPILSTWLDSDIYTADTTPDFSWSFTERARQFDVWVEKDGQAGPYHRSVVDARRDGRTDRLVRWTSEADMEDGVYRVWVRGRNANGVSPWSASNFRAVGGVQPIVTGTSDSGQNLRPTINWSEGVQSVDYELWVSSEATGQRVLLESNLTTNSFTPTEDLSAGIYKAWVRQTPQTGAALPWSEMVRFEVGQNTIPGTPTVAATPDPADATYHENLMLSWEAVTNGSEYEVWVSEIRTGERVIFEATASSSFAANLEPLPDFGTFRAWVRAIGSDGTSGQWSDYRQFNVATFTDGRKRVAVVGG